MLWRIVLSSFITQFAASKKVFGGPQEIALRNTVDEFFSLVMIASVRQYVDEREQIAHAYSWQLQEANARVAAANKRLSAHGFEWVCDANLNGIISDRLALNQIASNLLSNALKYTEHGEMRLSLSPVDSAS